VNITLNGCFGRTAPHPTFTLSTSPIYSNKEVKMFSGLVRTKVVAAHSKIATIVSAILLTSLFVSIPVPASANNCVPTSTTASNGETILTFANVGNCNWTVPSNVTSVRVLVVGGGSSGGAGVAGVWWPQGGAGGAVVENQSFNVSPGAAITVTVGAAGAAINTQGASSTSINNGGQSKFATITANGGTAPNNTQSRGGTSGNGNLGGSTIGGYSSGAGGGAGGVGSGLTGGVGINSNISDATVMYGSGGAGSNGGTGTASSGGGSNSNPPTANRGGGGSQPTNGSGLASAGAAGVVIVRYGILVACNPTSTTASNGDTIVSFTTVGACNWQVPSALTKAWVVAVGGGGAAGAGSLNKWWGAGGGGGEVISTLSPLTPGGLVPVVVGAGGITTDGSQSSFGTVVARAGKTPINTTSVGGVSGSGTAGGTGTTTTGNGGGGAQSPGVGINPGAGIEVGISGTPLEYGGGGNGYNTTGTPGTARSGAGTFGTAALANRGGGGSQMSGARGAGGSGVVILRYKTLANSNSPTCNSTVGFGGVAGVTTNQAGHGCVIIAYTVSGSITYQTFNYTGSDQSWTSPAATTELTFYLVGAGGGARNAAGRGPGGSGGFATASYTASSSTVFKIIVGQGGNGTTQSLNTYGGGGKADYGSGGGRSAIRIGTETEDLLTAGGGGGGGYDAKCGGAGGGTTGQDAVIRTSNGEHGKGGTQTAGGAGGYSVNNRTGGTGIKYQGGLGQDDSGGGGGGYWGGGGGGDNIGAGGGSGYFDPSRTTSATLVQGTCSAPGNSGALSYDVTYNGNGSTSGTVPAGQVVSAFSPITTATNSGSLVRTGFTFAGWNTAANGTGTTHATGATTFTPRSDTILYAQWNSTITYNANGATGTVPTAVTTTTDASRTFTVNSGSGLTRTGLSFGGWNTAADGTGTQVAGGASYTSTGSVTLFAIFRPTYTYNANGATGGTVPPSTLGPIPGTQCVTDPGFNNCRVISYTGTNQTFTVPSDIDATKGIMVEAWGAGGAGTIAYYGDPSGGAGGYSKAKINSPTAGSVLTVVVGQGGLVRDTTTKFGGGGAGGPASNGGSSGGGYSGVFSGAGTTTPILISGGGGAASPGSAIDGQAGGGGAASTTSTVQNGGQSSAAAVGGRGGTNTAGGAGATANASCATAGTSLQGGNGCSIAGAEGGSGGGGGYFGGGGGTYQTSTSGTPNGGGGGGSGFLNTTLATSVAAVKGADGVFANFAFPDRTSPNYVATVGRGGKPNTNTAADNTGGNGLVTIQWSSTSIANPVASNTGALVRTGYRFAGWNTAANGNGTSVPEGSTFPSSTSVTLFATWEPDNTGLTPSFNTNISDPIGVLANTAYVINTAYTNNVNDLVLSQYVDKIQIIATVPTGTLAITTTTNLTLPIGYQSALNTAAGTISFVGNLADVNAALATLRYTAPATAANTTITITASYAGLNGDYRYNATTGSYYFRNPTPVVWANAYNPTTAASNCGVKFNGMCGYMAVPNTVDESTFIGGKLGTGWIGVIKSSGLKYIDNAPSAIAGTTVSVTNWNTGEGSLAGENYVGISVTTGKWADLSTQSYNPIYEFGGKSETPLFGVLTRTIAIGALVATGTPTLATASDTGTSSTDKITNDNTPTINIGGLTVGATITLTATPASGPAVTCTFVATTTTGSCTFPTLSDGTYSIVARQTLGGTTTAASTALSNVVIDATRPTVTLTSSQIVSGGNRTATPATPGLTNQITVTFSETISGLLISEITKNIESTGWVIAQNAFTTSPFSSNVFTVTNATGAGGIPGILRLSVLEGVASDVAGNTNTATASDFVINTLIQLTLTNEYQQSPLLNPVVGGNNATIAQTTPGGAITMPGQGTLTRVGHTFVGWSLVTTNGSGAVVGATYTPTVPVKLYSSWTPNVYVVTYNANGGNGAPATASQSFNYGGTALSPSEKGTLNRTGYTFAGWSLNTAGTGTIYANSSNGIASTTTSYTPTASVIFYAKWNAGTFAVTFDANSGSGTQMSNLSITAGTAVTLTTNTYTRAGFTFNGWNTLANGTGTAYANSASVTLFANTTLYAQWVIVKPGAPSVTATTSGNTTATVTVAGAAVSGTTSGEATSYSIQTYENDGTTVVAGKTCTVLATASPLTCQITGLTNGNVYKFLVTAINTTGSTPGTVSTVTATPAPFVVTYSLNSGTLTPETANYNLGSPLTLPLPTRSGYTFAGWHAEAGLTTLVGNNGGSYSPTADTTLYAKWNGLAYSITYNGNGNTGGAVPTAGSYINGGSAYSVSDNTGVLVKTGYTFDGWYSNTTGADGTPYAAAASYSSAENIILYAKWNPVGRTVTYNLGSGTGTIPTQLTGRFIGSTFTTVDGTGFSRSGFAFAGWSDGTNIYAAGATYTVAGADVVLTAQWTAVSYSVTFLSNGADSGTAPTQANLIATQTFVVPANPFTKTGFNFTGWNDGTSNYLPNATYTMTAANTVLVAQWTGRGYAITYNGNSSTGGSVPTAGNFVTGSPAYSVALNTFTKTGHVFTGWKTAADGTGTSYAPGAGYSSTADVILYAQWAPASYTITFNGNGANDGTAPTTSSQSWTYSSTAPLQLSTQGTLAKTGFTFNGWATTANATAGVTSASPEASTTYYAVWTATQYTVTYAAGTGATGNIASPGNKTLGQTFILDSGLTLTAPPTADNVSYSFGFWSDGTKIFKGGDTYVMPASNVILTANWIAIYNVTYNPNGGTTTNASEQKAVNNEITIGSAATRTGYTFVKWADQGTGLWNPGETTTVTATRFIFSAQWSANTNSITYDGNSNTGGSVPAPGSYVTDGAAYAVLGNTGSLVRAGYTFAGWNTAADGTGTNYPAGVGATYALPANVILYAKWQPGTYTITYNGSGATGGATPSNGSFTTGGTYSIPANSAGNLAKTGFTFAGWSTEANGGGTSYADAATTLTTTSDVILYAKWSAASYTVTYALNGGTGSPPAQNPVQYGSTFTLAAAASQDGKNFVGWSDGTNTYGGGATYTMGTANITLTAQWQNQVYAITYALNGGSGTTPTQNGLASGDKFTVATPIDVTKTGYTFAGWNTGSAPVAAGAEYTMTANNLTLTAVWTIAAPASPSSVTAVGGDGSATITVAASSSGGAPTSYVVTASSGGGSCTVISPATSCVILGLTNGTAYTFSATAVNSIGTSSGTASSSITPAGKPDAPTGVNAVIGNGSATVSFTAPTVTGGPAIASYTVTASPGGATCTVTAPATSCVVPGLTNGTAYTFAVTASNGLFTSSPSTSSSSVVPATVPGAPTSVTATGTSSGTATIAFTAPTSNGGSAITGYTVTPSPATVGASCTGSGTSYTCTGLTDGVAYTFAVVAVNAVGNSTAGTNSTALTTQGAASAPTTISATRGDGQATVTFSGATANGSTITSYTVKAYDSTGNEVSGATCTVTTANTGGSCIITGLTNGSSYTFKAITNSTANSTAVSSVPSIATTEITPAKAPDAPSGVSVVAGTGKISVSWEEPASNGAAITSYTVTSSPGGFTCTVSAPATTCDVSTGLVAGTNYTFQVTATSLAGTSAASSASTSVAVNASPSAPINVTAIPSNASATVSWDPPVSINGSAITGYTVTAYKGGVLVSGATCTTTTAETCAINGLTNGDEYTFKVTATNDVGTSVVSVASAAVTPSTVPNAPSAVTAVVGDTQATISFTAPTNNGGAALTSYTVTSSPGDFTCTVNAPTTSCIVSGLSNGTAYTFTVKATNANGDSLASTASSSITPAKAPDAPTNVLVVAGTEKITVSWTAPASNGSPITSYTVQAYDSSGTAVAGATCVATAPAVTCDVSTNLVAGNQYTFKVTATSTAGTSLASDASTEIAVNAAPSPPINVAAVASSTSATVSWDAPINTNGSAITGYTVTAYTLGNVVSGTCTTDSATTTCSITSLANGVEYIFRAVATNGIGTSAESVASAPATPSTVPNAPTSLTVAVGNTEATISFTPPVNDGGSPVTIYTVTASNGASATGTSSPIEMVGLTNDTAYTFTVKATNKNGDSVASVASNPVTPADTFAPTLSSGVQPTGKPYVGLVLTSVMTFNGAPDPTLTYQWKSCTSPVDLATCTNITGATSRTLLLTSAEEGQFVVVTVVATNSRGSETATSDPTEVINPAVSFIAPSGTQSGTVGSPFVLSLAAAGGIGAFTYTVSAGTMPAGVSLDPATGQISGAPTTAGTYTFTVRAADSNGVFKEVIVTITVAAAPANAQAGPRVPIRNAEADRAAADALAKAAADKAAADKAVAEKVASDTAATTASTKAAADVAAAVAAATAAVEKAAAAAVAQAAADAAAARAEVQAKAAAAARAAATKAAADAQAAIRNSTTTAAAKAAATKSANTAAAAAAAAVRAAATAAQQATKAKATAANANKQVDIAINSLNSKTAASQASEQANAIAAAAKAAANEAAAAAATKAAEARATAAAAQKTAVETAARIATEQKAAADAAARAKLATDAAAKATADKIAATEAARVAAEASLKILNEKATLAEQAVKATTETAREEINKKIEEVTVKAEEAQKVAEEAATKADAAAETQATAVQAAETATKEAQTQAVVAVAVKAESVTKTAAAAKAAAAATVATKVATAAKAAAAKVPSKAVIVPKPSTSKNKNSAKATVTGLKPGQKVKVTVNVKPRP
jgi:uncharacterized repeat protein (TIGR02543 family)